MNIAYISLIATVIVGFLKLDKRASGAIAIVTVLLGLYTGNIQILGLIALAIFSFSVFYYQNFLQTNYLSRIIGFLVVTAFALQFYFHFMAGFANTLLWENIRISANSCPMKMWLNIDKVMMAVILFLMSQLYLQEKIPNLKDLKFTGKMLFLNLVLLLGPVLISGYMKFDFKLSQYLPLWFLNNLFFIAFSEEVIFRGFIQKNLMELIPKSKYQVAMAIGLASVAFGLSHYSAGILNMVFAGISGVFFGLVYHKTQSILCAMLIHFGLNLLPFIFFTYPAACQTY